LDAAHFISRGEWATRFDPDNVLALCRGCHNYLHHNPWVFSQMMVHRLGIPRYEALTRRANDQMRGKRAHREQKEITRFYKAEFERIKIVLLAGDKPVVRNYFEEEK
jgi:hypothetical protein